MTDIYNQGVPIYFEEKGAGPPVILGHSFLCSGQMWREQVPALATRFRVINPDLRGHGRSGQVAHPFTLYDALSDAIAVLDELGIARAIWCGLSIGGMVALRAALVHPDRVAGLVLLDTDAGRETTRRKVKYHAMGVGARVLGLRPFLAPITRLMFGTTTHRENAPLVAEWSMQFAGVHVPSALRCLEALMRRDSLLDRLHEVGVPALVLVGEEDRSLPVPLSRRIHDRLRHSTFGLISRAGHLSPLERPAQVTDAILGFLTAHAH